MSSSVFSHKQQKHGVIGSISRLSLSLVLARFSLVLARSTHHIISMQQPMDVTHHNTTSPNKPSHHHLLPAAGQCRDNNHHGTRHTQKQTPNTHPRRTPTHTHIRHIRIGQYTMYHLSDTQLTDLQDHNIINPQLFGQV